MLTGKQFYLPREHLRGVKKEDAGIVLDYETSDGMRSTTIPKMLITDVDVIWNSLEEIIKIGQGKKSILVSSENSYSVICARENILDSKYQQAVSILSKLLKISTGEVIATLNTGFIQIKNNLNEEKSKILHGKLHSIGLNASVVKNEQSKEELAPPMKYRLFTFTTIISIICIPGAFFLWIIIVDNLLKHKFSSFKINPYIFIAATVVEMQSAFLYSSDIEPLSMLVIIAVNLVICSLVAINISSLVNTYSEIKISKGLSAIFGLVYVNHKLNEILDS